MKFLFKVSLFTFAITLSFLGSSCAQNQTQILFPQGTFEGKTRDTLTSWNDPGRNAQFVTEGGNTFVHFSNNDATQSKTMEAKIKVDPSWKTLRFKTRMRATITKLGDQGWYGARFTPQFTNAKGPVLPHPPQPRPGR